MHLEIKGISCNNHILTQYALIELALDKTIAPGEV